MSQLYANAQTRIAELEAEVGRLQAALGHYADPESWVTSRSTTGHDVFFGWAGASNRRDPWKRALEALTEPTPTPATAPGPAGDSDT